MKARKLFTIAVIAVIIVHSCEADQLVRMCYYRAESRKRTTAAQFGVEHIDFSLCTHYIYAYGKIDASNKIIQAMDPLQEDGAKGHYNRFNHAKQRNRGMKTLLSVGGPTQQAHQAFTSMDGSDLLVFARSAAIFLRNRGFDGLDIDWPLPENYYDRDKLPRILQVLRKEFDDDTPRLLLTVAASGLQTDIDRGFDASLLQSYLDYLLIKTHSLYLPVMVYAHFSSPLFHPPSQNTFPHNTLSMNYSIYYWNAVGIPFKKMVVGITGAGRYLELKSALYTRPLAVITRTVLTGPYYQIPSGLAYPEVCFMMDRFELFYDNIQKCPYMVKMNQWIGFDNATSLKEKLAWVKTMGVAGIMFAAMDEDDFSGSFCEDEKFPLLKYIKSQIGDEVASSTTPTTTTTTTTTHLPQEDTVLSLNNTMIITIFCFFLYGFAIGLGFLILSKRDT